MKKHQCLVSLALFASFVLSACGAGQIFGPTFTPTPTLTLTPTFTPNPTLTATPTLTLTSTLTPESLLGQLGGRVFLSSDNEPISDFTITLEGSKELESTTDVNGEYSFADLEPGVYSVSISWNLDKGGNPPPCQQFQIGLPSTMSGTALNLTAVNDVGERIIISVGLEVEIKAGSVITADFPVECN